MQQTCAVVVAAGAGARLGAGMPKALVELGGMPLVRRAVRSLLSAGVEQIVVTCAPQHRAGFEAALAGLDVRLVPGGERRQDSVRLGLAAIEASPDAVVLVHDAARALVPEAVIGRVIAAVTDGSQAVVPVVPVVDSIRQIHAGGSSVVDRTQLRAVQTPQGFPLGLLRRAHSEVLEKGITVTDDAAAAEAIGCQVSLVPGDSAAFKITTPLDLVIARYILEERP